jgi:hypothetical protein
MDRKDTQLIEALSHVVEFGETHKELFPKNTLGRQIFAELGQALSQLSEHASEGITRRNAVHASTGQRKAACDALRQQMQRISDTARVIALDSPEARVKFQMPQQRQGRALILAGRAFAAEAESMKDPFVRLHLPDNFIDQLKEAIANVEQAMLEQGTNKIKRASNSSALDDARIQAMKLLKRADVVVGNIAGGNAQLLEEWETGRRIPALPSRAANSAPSPTTEPAQNPAA